jgi:hypothetical protein
MLINMILYRKTLSKIKFCLFDVFLQTNVIMYDQIFE